MVSLACLGSLEGDGTSMATGPLSERNQVMMPCGAPSLVSNHTRALSASGSSGTLRPSHMPRKVERPT